MTSLRNIRTLGQHRKSGYVPRTVEDEMRENLLQKSPVKKRSSRASLASTTLFSS